MRIRRGRSRLCDFFPNRRLPPSPTLGTHKNPKRKKNSDKGKTPFCCSLDFLPPSPFLPLSPPFVCLRFVLNGGSRIAIPSVGVPQDAQFF